MTQAVCVLIQSKDFRRQNTTVSKSCRIKSHLHTSDLLEGPTLLIASNSYLPLTGPT